MIIISNKIKTKKNEILISFIENISGAKEIILKLKSYPLEGLITKINETKQKLGKMEKEFTRDFQLFTNPNKINKIQEKNI